MADVLANDSKVIIYVQFNSFIIQWFYTFLMEFQKKYSTFFKIDSGIFCIITVLVPDEAVLETLIIFLISKTMISGSLILFFKCFSIELD